MTTIANALQAARQRILPFEARLLLREALGCATAWLETHCDDELAQDVATRFTDWVARREAGEPVAYLLGVREFYGRDFAVSPAVLIPRPDTEVLVDAALAWLREHPLNSRVLDLGTGSGCIAVSLALDSPSSEVSAVDYSAAALAVAQGNAAKLHAKVRFLQGSWLTPLAGERFALIVSNPPYIAVEDAHLGQGDLRFEPASALASGTLGSGGLDDIRQIITAAPDHLQPGGCLMLEHGYDQAASVAKFMRQQGFGKVQHHADLAGILRVTVGEIP